MLNLNDPSHTWIIAELSGNHNQDYAQAEALIRAAAAAEADAVKVQTFTSEEICADIPFPFGHNAQTDAWFDRLGVTRMRELMAKGGLPRLWHAPLKALAESLGLTFISTPFSVDAARFLVEDVDVEAVKVASGDLTFTPMLEYLARTDLPLIVSTGAATLAEVREAVYGPLAPAYRGGRLTLLHCLSVYPADAAIMNLRCIETLRKSCQVPVGLSDHTLDTQAVPLMAIALGATVIEKHLRLFNDTSSIDAAHSLEPHDFTWMVENIRDAEQMLGDGVKTPHVLELHDRLFARREPSDWLRPMMRGRMGDWE